MGRLADRVADMIASYVDTAIRKLPVMTAVGTVVTSPQQSTTDPLTVVVDGSALSVPVKQVRGLPLVQGARVVLVKFGSDWAVVGSLTNPAIGTNTSRIVIGADTPEELQAYGITTAILSYITDKTTGIEVGYFFMGTTNEIDAFANTRAQVFGNVTYPIPGSPDSATSLDVKTNFQQDMWAQVNSTIFKDHITRFWEAVSFEPANGMSFFRVSNRDSPLVVAEDLAAATANINCNSAPAFVTGTLVTLPNVHATDDVAWCEANVDFAQSVSGATTGLVELVVNGGAAQPGQALFAGLTAGARAVVAQRWKVPLTAVSGTNTFELRASRAGGADNQIVVQGTHTRLHVTIKTTI